MKAAASPTTLRLEAPAKLNLTLEVTGVEANGYHTLDTLFVWLELHDSLELTAAGETTLEVRADGVDTSLVTDGEENLVLRALRALEQQVGHRLPTRLLLTKRIPSGGGLGGGSADAAATLVGLRALHNLPVDDETLHALAARLGADVAFGLRGGFARGQHYGERLQSLSLPEDLRERTVLLLAPGFACPTPQVYRAWDQAPSRPAEGTTERFLQAPPEQRLAEIANDLQPAAEALFPHLGELARQMREAGLEAVTLSGSGSTLFGFVPPGRSVEELAKRLAPWGKVMLTKLREDQRGE